MRNRIKNCDKMGELRKGNLCLNHIRTASPVGRSGRERTVALPQHTSYGLHQAARAWSSRCRHFASAHFIRAAPRPCTGSSSRCAFASAHFIWAAPQLLVVAVQPLVLCLSTLHMGCTGAKCAGLESISTLPQHTSYGLHRQNCTETWIQHCKMCCERVDSFSTT